MYKSKCKATQCMNSTIDWSSGNPKASSRQHEQLQLCVQILHIPLSLLLAMSDLVGNEYNFMHYSEKIVQSLQTALRAQQNLHDLPVIEIALKIEEIVYNQAIKNCGIQNVDRVWDKLEAVRWYQAKCEKISKNAQIREFNVTHVEGGNANAILQELFRDDYTAPKQPKPRVKAAAPAAGTAKAKNPSKKGGAKSVVIPNFLLQQQQQQLLQEQYNFVANLPPPPPLVSTFSLPTPHFIMPKLGNSSNGNDQIDFNLLPISSSTSPPSMPFADNDDGLDFLLEDSNFSTDMTWATADLVMSPEGKQIADDVQTPSLQQKREQERAEREAIQQTVHFGDGDGDGGLMDLMDF